MITEEEFLNKYSIPRNEYDNSGINWNNLVDIYNDFLKNKNQYRATSRLLLDALSEIKTIHSFKARIKDPYHVIAKIIRKKYENIDKNNYKEKITDLIGIRALHLFKEDWEEIHEKISEFIQENYELYEKPIANVRKGDSNAYISRFKTKGCLIRTQESGYRSVHYLIKSIIGNKKYIVELQVRTIFEEAWSEIDHLVRYPNYTDNKILNEYLTLFNRVAGTADEMGSYVRTLTNDINIHIKKEDYIRNKKRELINEIENTLNGLDINKNTKKEICNALTSIAKLSHCEITDFNLKN